VSHPGLKTGILIAAAVCCLEIAGAGDLNWPANRLLPAFPTPVSTLDCIDVTSLSGAESDLFGSLEGIVNRTQPRIACVVGGQEGGFTWLNLHNLPYTLINGYSAIVKYRTNVTGLVVTDPNQPHTLNLATTIAGVNNELICDPSLLAVLTNAPYNLAIVDDLRGRFSDQYQVYRYLYTNYWPLCTHRVISGMNTNLHGNFRDYIVAIKAATVWLDPGTFNFTDQSVLGLFLSDMTPAGGVYTGWWPSEANGLNWIYQYGIPVLASDYLVNASVFGGVSRTINVPDIPLPPPLQNKVYVSMILSDGDNIQYMQHAMKMNWDNLDRGGIPIGWTVSPLAADVDPVMLNYYWSTATTNDCLISGPSGAGYTHMQNWNAGNLAAFTKVSDSYLERSGLRIITVWDQVTSGVAQSFATNCPSLFGLTDQSGGSYTSVNLGLRTVGLAVAYSSDTNAIYSGITNAARTWDGTAPLFIAVQADVWNLGPTQLRNIANSLDKNEYVLVRPDHLFLLCNRVFGPPVAVTKGAIRITAGSATLQGIVTPNATNTIAWLEWGTNVNYGSKSLAILVNKTNSLVPVSATVTGLAARATYHYRVAASNALGTVWGADKTFTTGNRLKAWGEGGLGQTNVPPGLTNVVEVGCGAYHGLALNNSGAVVAWGYNAFGQTNVPADLGGVVQVAGGMQHSLALKADGTVAAWGDNTYGQTNIPAGLSNVVEIAAGTYHNLALKADGTVAAWGYNNFGQTNVPAGLSNVVGVAAGVGHNLALRADGTVLAWGNNSFGQTNVPAGLNHVVSVAAGQYHSLSLKAGGVSLSNLLPVSRWVADSLSGSDGSSVSNWTDISGGKSAVQAIAGNRPRLYSNALNGHKTVRFASGSSQYLTVASADSPISAAGSFTLIVVFKTSTPGNVSSLFYQNTGLLGCEQPGVVADWALCINGVQLGAGLGAGAGGCGSDLSLYGGNVADGNPHIAMYVRCGGTISLYADGTKVAEQSSLCTAARGDYSFQIGAMTTGSLFFNGDIAEIQLYDRGLNSWEIMSANEILAAAYGVSGATGSVVVWGNNANGQTNVPSGLSNVTATTCGGSFNLALRGDGSVIGWGNDNTGQTNLLPGLTNVSAVAGGMAFGAAIGNQTPLAYGTTISGYANHDLTLALPGVDPDGNPLSFRVLSLPAAGALYQYSGGTRGLPISAPNTLVSDAAGRIVFAPSPGGTGNPYAGLGFMAQDGLYSSDSAQVAVNISLPAAPQFASPAWNSGNSGTFQASLSGDSNATYSVWASSNLVNWEKIGVATEVQPGEYEFMDTVGNRPQRFYRAGAP
jgi:hypothetical protein